jgi:tRNA nucleotidyltransferase/poly(A) polymerase
VSEAPDAHHSAARDSALTVLRRLRESGFEAYFAGGCVRDLLMGQKPKDYDVATNAPPERVRKLFKNTQSVGAAFGVILVREGDSVIEVATFRTDLTYQDGRHPTGVQFSTAAEDAQRRDFTINGLFFDPVENRIIDYVGGQADLAARTLRAIGDANQRFAEDHLRMLRAVRFGSRLGFEIEPATAKAISAHSRELIRISPERIAEELRKMLTPVSRSTAYRLLIQFGFIPILLRFLPEKLAGSGANFIGLFPALDRDVPIAFGLGLAAIVLDFRMLASGTSDPKIWLSSVEIKKAVHAVRQALKISNDESAEMAGAMAFVQLLGEPWPSVAVLKRFLNQPHAADAMLLMNAMAGCGLLGERIGKLMPALKELRQTEYAPAALITGDDLTAAGATPGPGFKLALDAAYDAQLERRISSREEAMEMAMALVKKPKIEIRD